MVDNTTDLSLRRTIELLGTLSEDSSPHNADLIIATPTVSLADGGRLLFSDSSSDRLYDAIGTDNALINQAGTIAGAGQIGINTGGAG